MELEFQKSAEVRKEFLDALMLLIQQANPFDYVGREYKTSFESRKEVIRKYLEYLLEGKVLGIMNRIDQRLQEEKIATEKQRLYRDQKANLKKKEFVVDEIMDALAKIRKELNHQLSVRTVTSRGEVRELLGEFMPEIEAPTDESFFQVLMKEEEGS